MKKKLAVLLAAMMVAALGCSSVSMAEDENITVIIKNTTTPFFLSIKEGAEQAGEDFGANVTVKAPTDTDQGAGNEQQTTLAEEAIAEGVDCVVMCPVDSEAIVPAVQKIVDAGIPVIALNTRLADESLCETFAGLENITQGYNTMMKLLDGMDNEGTLFIIEGTTGAQTSIDRVEGALQAIEDSGADVEVLAQQSGNYSRAETLNVVQNLLQSYPDVDAIFCCNDEMALGAVEAVDSAGLTGEILIAGQDANDDAIEALREGKIYVDSYGNPYMQGYESVRAAVDVLRNGEPESDFYEVGTVDVTLDNIDTYEDEVMMSADMGVIDVIEEETEEES